MLLKEVENDLFEYTLSGVDRLIFRDCLFPQFMQVCPGDFLSNLRILEIDFREEMIDASFWQQLTGKCSQYLQNLRLRRLLLTKKNYPALNKFIETCKKLTEFTAARFKFECMYLYSTLFFGCFVLCFFLFFFFSCSLDCCVLSVQFL